MNISVINGSPKGENSITLSFSGLLEKAHKEHNFTFINAARDIAGIEKNPEKQNEVLEQLAQADLVIWSFPVYFLSVPSQLMRFIYWLLNNKGRVILRDKYAISISTSGKYFDHTTHDYIQAISEDMGMRFLKNFTADAPFFLNEQNRIDFLVLFRELLRRAESKQPVMREYQSVDGQMDFLYAPEVTPSSKTEHFKTIIIADIPDSANNVESMINTYKSLSPGTTEVINLRTADIKGGCTGCCRCMLEGKCIYKDKFRNIYDDAIHNADIIIYAGTVENCFLSPLWKQFLDRGFYCGHKPVFEGKQFGIILSGSWSGNRILRDFFEGYVQTITGSSLYEHVTDECMDSRHLTEQMKAFTSNLSSSCREKLKKPHNFLGAGGQKIFRDLVYSLSWFFTEEHKYYKKTGKYDFPNTNPSIALKSLIMGTLMSIPGAKSKMAGTLNRKMKEPYEKILQNYR